MRARRPSRPCPRAFVAAIVFATWVALVGPLVASTAWAAGSPSVRVLLAESKEPVAIGDGARGQRVTLAREGFIHASRADQVAGVYARYYADATEPLVLLEIDTDLLGVPWREDPVGDDTYPHIYGPLAPSAVVAATPFDGARPPISFR